MNKEDYKEYTERMKKSIDSIAADFAAVRAGRANAAVLDRITVDYYGTPTPIHQIASIASPDGTRALSSSSTRRSRSPTSASTRRTTASPSAFRSRS